MVKPQLVTQLPLDLGLAKVWPVFSTARLPSCFVALSAHDQGPAAVVPEPSSSIKVPVKVVYWFSFSSVGPLREMESRTLVTLFLTSRV